MNIRDRHTEVVQPMKLNDRFKWSTMFKFKSAFKNDSIRTTNFNWMLFSALLITSSFFAQQNDTIVYYSNKTIAFKKQNDSVYLYNSSGVLRQINDLKYNKSTPFGLPKEVQNIIYNFEIPERLEISEETFPTYLFTERYVDEGIVLCHKRVFYNSLGLKTGFNEKCPSDTSDGTNYSGEKDFYTYNTYGLLVATKGGFVNHYNEKGQLTAKSYQNRISKKTDTLYKYNYVANRLTEAIRSSPEKAEEKYSYCYNDKGLLIEITKLSYFDTYNTRRKSILFKYNAQNKISEVSQIKIFKKHKSERTFLTYQYDFQHRINSIKIGYAYGDSVKGYDYVYDSNGNLISVNLNGKIIRRYVYNSNGTLVHIANNWGREKGYLKYDD